MEDEKTKKFEDFLVDYVETVMDFFETEVDEEDTSAKICNNCRFCSVDEEDMEHHYNMTGDKEWMYFCRFYKTDISATGTCSKFESKHS